MPGDQDAASCRSLDWQRDDRCPALVSRRRSGCLPGCLFGAYCYQAGLFDDRTMQVVEDAMRLWRKRLRGKLDEVCMAHPPKLEVDLDGLADGVTVLFEGSFIVSRMLNESALVAGQLRHYRNYLELLFDAK